MKKIFFLSYLSCLLLNQVTATPVYFPVLEMTGNTNDVVINVRAVNNPIIYNSGFHYFPKDGTNLTTVASLVTNHFVPGAYDVSVVGLPKSWKIHVTNSATAVNAVDLSKEIIRYSVSLTSSNLQVIPDGVGGYSISDTNPASGSGGNGGTVATETNSIYVSALDGDDDTGARGNRNLPFLTVTAAMAASQSGDIIYVLRGQYVENFLGADGVVFDLATDALVGGATMPGPIFLADSIDYRIQGNGFITATNTKPSVMTSGTGTIYLSGVTLSPNTVTNNVKGTWFTP